MSAYDDLTFAPMLITDVFDTMKSSSAWFDKVHLKSGEPKVPYLSQTHSANSIAAIVADQGVIREAGNCITVTLKTQATFYQPVSFYTAQNFLIFRHKLLNAHSGLLLTTIMRRAMQKFSWGYGVSMARLVKTRIMVPVTTDDFGDRVVDWEGMTRLGEELTARAVTRANSARTSDDVVADTDLPDLRFAPMFVIDLPRQQRGIFHAHKGKRLIAAHRKPGRMPFVAGSRVNNSIVGLADVPALFPGGWVSLIYNGDGGTGHAKYQPMPFNASDDVTVLEPAAENATEEALLMLVTMLTQQCVPKFGFGYKLTLHRLGRQRIMVPVATDDSGDEVVDWDGMTLYGKILRARAERQLSTPTTVSG
ncbi:restriction endonuclease subunit S [Leucobacter sp. cx-169]|uniref:restriction endonuclease subunit S n=1 Tax=Leucobacter sp. cx-169 TaxID=2770549 RepID=UPI00165DCBF8|nr:restriction endonuclease subunit S [Leucobacter sp. cx-169]MBC9927230.1 restriction endonuclease subunit S [Leucobacter sp. cx-169]